MATYYISPSGNDTTGNGSSGNPWLTISKAHTSATSGDTIICKDGTYTWVDQTFTKNLTIQAENTGLAIFDGGGAAKRWILPAQFALTGLIFEDVVSTSDIFRCDATVSLTVTLCSFRSITTQGAFVPGARFGLFLFYNLATTRTATFVSCLFDDILDTNSGSTTYDFIFGHNDGAGGILNLSFIGCVFYFATSGSSSKNNIIRSYTNGATNTAITNSIFANFNGETVTMTSTNGTTMTTTATYSDFYNITSAPSGTGNITSDPLFVDAANGNFNLRPTSPCINTGTLV